MARSLFVAGGGLAGLAAALEARKRGDEVTLAEAGAFGHDKVCGEFLSPEVDADFAELGCADWIEKLGAIAVRRVAIFGPERARIDLTMPGPPAHCVTRGALESYLSARAEERGVRLLSRSPVRTLAATRGQWNYRAGEVEGESDGVVCAFGKRSTLDRELKLPRAFEPERFVAAKVYFEAPRSLMEADVELFLLRDGYVGLNPVEGGRLALCALFEGEPTSSYPRLRERFAAHPALAARLDRLGTPVGPVRGLAKFGFGFQKLAEGDPSGSLALFAGDCARMIPSFTGDGMAVAVRSGRLAAKAFGQRDPARAYAKSYRREFETRFRVASVLHHAFLSPRIFRALAPIVGRSEKLVERIYDFTRGAAFG
jgi:flavin-dependent dehydrogenase